MRYRFLTADVFTEQAYGGNPLAVLPEAAGLNDRQMQAIAREFNLSETVFVLPPADPRHAAKLRIFTPAAEILFAGHPTIGTALILADQGKLPLAGERALIVLEEGAGLVPVSLELEAGQARFAWLTAPRAPELRPAPSAELIAATLSLPEDALVTTRGAPIQASCGTPFLLIELVDRAALAAARLDHGLFARHLADLWAPWPFLFTADAPDGYDLQARMFAPSGGVPEDPATGSATAALGGWLGETCGQADARLHRVLAQGIEMGRPSRLELIVERQAGRTTAVKVGGAAVLISEGTILAPELA